MIETAKSMMRVMPEAFRLRMMVWQLFVTLTFRQGSSRVFRDRKISLFGWLRDIAHTDRIHFKRLIWVARYEFGKAGEGHFHLCLAGLQVLSCREYESFWFSRAGFAQIEPYQKTRDGIGYCLKLAADSAILQDDYPPMLSDSCFETLRRGRPM
jgi:hypothetical protein